MAALLGAQAVGATVKITVNGAARDFIVVHKGAPSSLYPADDFDRSVILLQKNVEAVRAWSGSANNDYAVSSVHSWLNGDYLNGIDAALRGHVRQVRVPYRAGAIPSTAVSGGAGGLSCKVFLLSMAEVGGDNPYGEEAGPTGVAAEGAKLDYFIAGSAPDALARRAAYPAWWLRSPNTANSGFAWAVGTNGVCLLSGTTDTTPGPRPALALPSALMVNDDGSLFANEPPGAPGTISYGAPLAGQPLTVTCSAVADPDGDPVSYVWEARADSALFATAGSTGVPTVTLTAPAAGTNWQIRVKAVDDKGGESAYTTGLAKAINYNKPPRVSLSTTNAGEKRGGFSITYTVDDDNAGDTLTAIVKADGVEIARMSPAVRGQAYPVTISAADWLKAAGGAHEITVTVDDGKGESAAAKCAWSKTVAGINVATKAFAFNYMPSKFTLLTQLSAPAGTAVKWEACNNALDANPAWENISAEVAARQTYHFQNQTKTAGFWAGALRLTTVRGSAGETRLTEIRGVFEE